MRAAHEQGRKSSLLDYVQAHTEEYAAGAACGPRASRVKSVPQHDLI